MKRALAERVKQEMGGTNCQRSTRDCESSRGGEWCK